MTLKISNSLPLKYVLETHTALPSYPTGQDFIFDTLNYLIRVSDSKSKTFNPAEIKFSSKTLKYVFGDRLADSLFLEKIKLIIKDLIEDGSLVKVGDSLMITESCFLNFYTVSQNL